jgi:hypothetical protein
MGYSLRPRNKALKSFHFGAFSWLWMLDEGVGYVIGYGRGVTPGTWIAAPDPSGRFPTHEDGFRVSAEQARAMAMAARGVVAVYRHVQREHDAATPEERARREEQRWRDMYRTPVRADFLDLAEAFAAWADESRGFGVW